MTKYLIFKLFGGGYCNQLFSLETSIYLSNILKRKLILWINYPLLHIGNASWDYGRILDFFSDDYKQFLPYGFEVYYQNLPDNLLEIVTEIKDKQISDDCFSRIIFIDKNLNIENNFKDIDNFAYDRKKHIVDWNNDFNEEYIYTDKVNASRCFYNFYTTNENYDLMDKICISFTIYNSQITNIINNLSLSNNFSTIHCRFGDPNDKIIRLPENKNDYYLNKFIDTIPTNNEIVIMSDRKNTPLLNNMSNIYNLTYIEDILSNNRCSHNNPLWEFIILMYICSCSNVFHGTNKSTVSHYIQYLRYLKNKPCCFYFNNPENLNIIIDTANNYPWLESKYIWRGPAISWNVFWGTRKNWFSITL